MNEQSYPIRFFLAHCTKDKELMENLPKALKSVNPKFEVFVAEEKYHGIPLINKLKNEIFKCNALIVTFTKKSICGDTARILCFEIGMAFSLNMPIFIIKDDDIKLPWFIEPISDYININSYKKNHLVEKLTKLSEQSYNNPIDIMIPKEKHIKYGDNHSKNIDIVQENGLSLFPGFNGILHFNVVKNRIINEKNIRVIFFVLPHLKIVSDSGTIGAISGTRKLELYEVIPQGDNKILFIIPVLAYSKVILEIRIDVPKNLTLIKDTLSIGYTSDNTIGWKLKEIPITYKDIKI